MRAEPAAQAAAAAAAQVAAAAIKRAEMLNFSILII